MLILILKVRIVHLVAAPKQNSCETLTSVHQQIYQYRIHEYDISQLEREIVGIFCGGNQNMIDPPFRSVTTR